MWPIACVEEMIPGMNYKEKWAKAAKIGIKAIEMLGPRPGLVDIQENVETLKCLINQTGVSVSAISGSSRGCLLGTDKSEREVAMQDLRRLLEIAASLDAEGVIYGPTVGIIEGWSNSQRIPDLSPLQTRAELEFKLLVLLLQEIGEFAEDLGVKLILEPINRFQAYWPNKVHETVEVCRAVGSDGVVMMVDTVHMNIEEDSMKDAVQSAKGYIGYVHIASNTRKLPRQGLIDFQSFFQALFDIGYKGYVSLECFDTQNPMKELPVSLRYLRDIMSEIR